MFKNICLPTDGSVLATQGVRKGLTLARVCGASVTVVTVLTPSGFISDTGPVASNDETDKAKRCLDAAELEAHQVGVSCTRVILFDHQPYQAILEATRTHQCDLIAMASHARNVPGSYLGSETQRVLVHANVPVLVFK